MEDGTVPVKQDEDNEIFEITDFTNASPWEVFISEIENILVQWGLTTTAPSDEVDCNQSFYEQHQKSEKLTYAKHAFIISLHVSSDKKKPLPKQPDQNWPDSLLRMMDPINDFPPVAHHITRWYGIEQFVLITPDDNSEALSSEAQAKLMLSSISLAVYNVGCTTPIFIQIQKHWRHIYAGVCEGNGLRTNFDTVHLKKTPPQFDHLTGMINLFRSKLGKPPGIKHSPVTIAARITYYLRHWRVEDWPIEPLGEFGVLTEKGFSCLPMGATIDPVRELHLSALWSGLTEATIVDNSVTRGFNPLYAPLWTVKTNLVDNPGLILNEQINEFIKICYRQDSIEDLLGNKLIREDMRSPGVGSSDFSHALTRLTGPPSSMPSFSSVMYSSSSRLEFGSEIEPISDEELDIVLQYLFPDSGSDSSESDKESSPLPEDKTARLIKSAHPDSFTARLARVLCIVNREYGLKAFAHVWYEVVLELRYRWEKGICLIRVGNDVPDMMSCLLHQKLQMLNCCIQHKISHAQRRRTPSSSPARTSRSSVEPDQFHSPSSSLSYSQRVAGQEETMITTETRKDEDSKNDFHSCSSSDDEFFEAFETPKSETSLQKSIKELSLDSTLKMDSPSVRPKSADLKPVAVDPLSLTTDDDYTIPSSTTTSGTVAVTTDVASTTIAGDTCTNEETEGGSNTPYTRVGALEQYKDLILLRTGEPLYVPETQDPAPLTEDMLWEQQHVLSKLGTTEEATQVRAKMQSLSLISDMQSFKAANPGCVLEDFVRWYSPRDWVEGKEETEEVVELERAESHPTDGWEDDHWDEEDWGKNEEVKTFVEGHLSIRMRQPGNMWVESWENATPIPVYRQKRLFDDTKEAEKVLHYLSGLKLSELALMLLPLILHSAVLAVENKLKLMPLSNSDSLIQDSINILSTVQKPTIESLPIYQECLSLVQQAEHQFAIANSLLLKFHQGLEIKSRETDGKNIAGTKELHTSVQILIQENEELVLRDPTTSLTGIALQGLLLAQEVAQNTNSSLQKQSFSRPAAREFILRTVCPHPGPASSCCPHRMFCLISKDEMRLAACYSEDILLT